MSNAWTQIDALARAFFARFFESELTSGLDDMKQSFFWLLAALAMPGIFIPVLMSFEWGLVGQFQGYDVLRSQSLGEKAFYLGVSMVSAGALTAIAWTSLLPDRRDTLILGAMPVRAATVVAGKLAALVAYVGLIAVATHGVGMLMWGSLLGNSAPLRFMLRSFAAHFIASAAMTATTALAIAAAQGVALTVLGPRSFRRASTILQVLVVGLLALSFALLPMLNVAAAHTIAGGPRAHPWLLSMPPMWFLGLYEALLGNAGAVLTGLAQRAVVAFAVVSAVVVVTYPLAYRRLMVSVVEAGRQERGAFARRLQSALVRCAGRDQAPQAAAEFFSATMGRVERHRFVLAITFGLALAWSLPALSAYEPSPRPDPALLSLPIAVMMFLLVGLRVASVLPGDPRAAWLFEVHDIARADARRALERTMFVLGVLPPIVLSTPLYWWLWGPGVAVVHAAVLTALGVATIEFLLWHCDAMPCGRPWTPARFGFGRRWPLHAGLFLLVSGVMPRLEVTLFRSPFATAVFIAVLVISALVLRSVSAHHQIVPVYEEVDPVAGVLRLN